MVCEYLDDFGGKTCNDFHAHVLLPEVVVKLHANALKSMPLLSISIFGVLMRSDSQFASNIKKLFYYETIMSTVMDIVTLQGILCHVFQLSVEDVTEFGAYQVLRAM
jgi:predicted nucleotidyltransferase